jgi:hypothetical protein
MGTSVIEVATDMKQRLKPFADAVVGDPFASLVALKGRAGAAERDGKAPFSGADGLALDKAFGALGWGYGSQNTRRWLGVLLEPVSRPPLSARELRLLCEIIDPLAIVALDEVARLALIDAFASVANRFSTEFVAGSETWVLGRHMISVEQFEDALADETAKQNAWSQLKRCTFPS